VRRGRRAAVADLRGSSIGPGPVHLGVPSARRCTPHSAVCTVRCAAPATQRYSRCSRGSGRLSQCGLPLLQCTSASGQCQPARASSPAKCAATKPERARSAALDPARRGWRGSRYQARSARQRHPFRVSASGPGRGVGAGRPHAMRTYRRPGRTGSASRQRDRSRWRSRSTATRPGRPRERASPDHPGPRPRPVSIGWWRIVDPSRLPANRPAPKGERRVWATGPGSEASRADAPCGRKGR
jgi:hypothetical protein